MPRNKREAANHDVWYKVRMKILIFRILIVLSCVFAAASAGQGGWNRPGRWRTQSSGLKIGEYACYGSGGTLLIGLGFKALSGGRYTDLDNKSAGTYVVSGTTVTFRGGHLGGQTGRDLKNYKFTLGTLAGCEPF